MVERDRRRARMRDRTHRAHIAAAKHPHRRARRSATFPAVSFAVQEALHIRQESHEFVVVALLKTPAVAAVFVHHFAPRRGLAHVRQQLPGLGQMTGRAAHRHQAQRP